MTLGPRVSAVVLAYLDEPLIHRAVEALLASEGVDLDVVLVDNGCTTDAVDRLEHVPRVTVLRPGRNTGFATGCNLGAAAATGDLLVFVNGDALVEPGAVAALAHEVADPSVGLASASLRILDRPGTVNSVGNPVHFSGLSWAGGLGDPAELHDEPVDVASITGAAVMARRDVFASLGGFADLMFAYCEDADLSLRCWQSGLRCRYVPSAVVLHRYEFSRNPHKWYLLERNRLIMVLTVYERRTLLLLAPALVMLELAMAAVALKQGWGRQKVAGWWWLLRHRDDVRRRRSEVQERRVCSDADLLHLLTGDFAPGAETGIAAPAVVRRGSRAYWWWVRRLLSADGTGQAPAERSAGLRARRQNSL